MVVTCPVCHTLYNRRYRSATCPHGELLSSRDDEDAVDLTVDGLVSDVLLRHGPCDPPAPVHVDSSSDIDTSSSDSGGDSGGGE